MIVLAAGFATVVCVTPVVAAPGMTTCALAPILPFDSTPEGLLFDRGLSPTDRTAAAKVVRTSRARIDAMFGKTIAQPYIIQLAKPDALWPLVLSPLASTHFVGTRACVIIGPAGRDIDVTAHELVHAEIFARVGAWQRRTQLPTWFDEGAAMQVDQRTDFDLPPTTSEAITQTVRSASNVHQFFGVEPTELTQHFALAKLDVGRWLARTNPRDFYRRLDEIRHGRRFEDMWREPSNLGPPD